MFSNNSILEFTVIILITMYEGEKNKDLFMDFIWIKAEPLLTEVWLACQTLKAAGIWLIKFYHST